MYISVLAPRIAGLKSKTAIQDQNPASSCRSKSQVHMLGSAPVPQGSPIHLILSFSMLNPQPKCKKSILFFASASHHGTGSVLLLCRQIRQLWSSHHPLRRHHYVLSHQWARAGGHALAGIWSPHGMPAHSNQPIHQVTFHVFGPQ